MRAGRLVDMLLILQRSGRVTARQLAADLEVSPRTVLRDVDALSAAGVPILTVQGAHGGIELLGGFRTDLTGLTIVEATALLLAGQPAVAERLGHASASAAVRRKLVHALPRELRDTAEGLDQWFLHDPDGWDGHRLPYGELSRLAAAIRRCVEVELHFRKHPTEVVRPIALVLKAGQWFLVDDNAPGTTVRNLDDLRGLRITHRSFERPGDLDLSGLWRNYVEHLEHEGDDAPPTIRRSTTSARRTSPRTEPTDRRG